MYLISVRSLYYAPFFTQLFLQARVPLKLSPSILHDLPSCAFGEETSPPVSLNDEDFIEERLKLAIESF